MEMLAVTAPEIPTPPPFCTAEEFDRLVNEMVVEFAPRLFAVVQILGERSDGRIAAWGMDFDDEVEVVDVEDQKRMRLNSPHQALHFYTHRPHISARLVWPGNQ
jgi:hypothetical protein